jgi:hypothetical protein
MKKNLKNFWLKSETRFLYLSHSTVRDYSERLLFLWKFAFLLKPVLFFKGTICTLSNSKVVSKLKTVALNYVWLVCAWKYTFQCAYLNVRPIMRKANNFTEKKIICWRFWFGCLFGWLSFHCIWNVLYCKCFRFDYCSQGNVLFDRDN